VSIHLSFSFSSSPTFFFSPGSVHPISPLLLLSFFHTRLEYLAMYARFEDKDKSNGKGAEKAGAGRRNYFAHQRQCEIKSTPISRRMASPNFH